MSNADKPTLVLGASPNPQRYSHLAVKRLRDEGVSVYALGRRAGSIEGVPIRTDVAELPSDIALHTLTLYVGPQNQAPLYDTVLGLNPKRIIFNPGAENPELREMAREAGIETEEACTLVMLRAKQF